MGNCFSSEEETHRAKVFEDFYYVCRDRKYLLRINDQSISKLKFDNSIKLRKDSGVGYLNDGRIIIGGGTDGAGCLTNKVFIINPINVSVLAVSNLPVASKEGAFFHYKEYIYYIGGIKDSDDEEILAQEQSSPIMRFFLEEGYWEVFNEKKKAKKTFQDVLKQNKNTEAAFDSEISYSSILYAGMFIIGSRVYLVNGRKMSARGVLVALPYIYSIDLEEEGFGFRRENFKSPLDSFRPICGSYENKAFITGGMKPNSKSCNKDSYIISFKDDSAEFTLVAGLIVNLDDCYPIVSSKKNYISISYPNLAVYDHSLESWYQFKFTENLLNRKNSKIATPFLVSQNQINNKVIKTTTNLVFQDLNASSASKISSGNSVSLDNWSSGQLTPASNIKFKMPPGIILDMDHNSSVNLSRESDLSVDQQIDLGLPQSPHSSHNLSDSYQENPIKKKMAPIAKQEKKIKQNQLDFSVDKRDSSVTSEADFEKAEIPYFDADSPLGSVEHSRHKRSSSSDSSSSKSKSNKKQRKNLGYDGSPIKKKLAPIAKPDKKVKKLKPDYSVSHQSSESDSFEFEPNSSSNKSNKS